MVGDEISNSTIPEANALSVSIDNPSVSINGLIGESFSDLPEDVDFFSFELEAGQTISLDIDTEEILPNTINFRQLVYPTLTEILQKPDTELRLFDADGNELTSNNDGAAADEDFSRDPYLEYTAETAGTYYVGVSQLGNRNYDPFTSQNGSGWTFPEMGVNNGFYELTATLAEATSQENFVTPIADEFEAFYFTQSLGKVPLDTGEFVPAGYGGIIFLDDDTLLVTGNSYSPETIIYAVDVTRDADTGSINGFAGPATFFAEV